MKCRTPQLFKCVINHQKLERGHINPFWFMTEEEYRSLSSFLQSCVFIFSYFFCNYFEGFRRPYEFNTTHCGRLRLFQHHEEENGDNFEKSLGHLSQHLCWSSVYGSRLVNLAVHEKLIVKENNMLLLIESGCKRANQKFVQ